jgi:hypothetical protein
MAITSIDWVTVIGNWPGEPDAVVLIVLEHSDGRESYGPWKNTSLTETAEV